MKLGIDSFVATSLDSVGHPSGTDAQRVAYLLEQIQVADQSGLGFFGIGEHHRSEYIRRIPPFFWRRQQRVPATYGSKAPSQF